MADHEPLRLPPERDVSPELRAQVLERALSADLAVRRRPRWAMPVAAGLAAAAVVFGVLVVVGGGSEEPLQPTTPDTATQPIPDHEYVKVDAGRMSNDVRRDARRACQGALPPDGKTGHLLASRRFHTPDGLIGVIAYDNPNAKANVAYQQYFCTPWAVVQNPDPDLVATAETPIAPIEDGRIQGLLPAASDPDGATYYEGTWFVTSSAVDAVEARIVVDGAPGDWYRSRRSSDYMYASVWQDLTPGQLGGDIQVEYRALNPDGALIEVPGLSTITVDPSAQSFLNEDIDIPTRSD